MMGYPEKISNEVQLEELISRPSSEAVEMFGRINGDIIFLGVSGKIGPSLARMAKRACDLSGIKKRVIGVARFNDDKERNKLENFGIETIRGNFLDSGFLQNLPLVDNVFFLAGMKFGSLNNPSLTWAANTYLPGLVAEYFKKSRIVAFSTGCVYPLVPVESGGSKESDMPEPVGEYAQSCLGRERIFEYGSDLYNTMTTLIRLNYSVELRYGVLVDIALKIKNGFPVDISMGHFNVIWQGDMNEFVLRSIELCSSPVKVLNVTGPETLSVRNVAEEFGKLFGVKPNFVNKEANTALLSNSSTAFNLFGYPKVQINQVMHWLAEWIKEDQKLFNKPTHFEVRNGKY